MESPFYPAADDPGLRLIESALWDGQCCPLIDRHMARLSDGAARLGWDVDLAAARAAILLLFALSAACRAATGAHRT